MGVERETDIHQRGEKLGLARMGGEAEPWEWRSEGGLGTKEDISG